MMQTLSPNKFFFCHNTILAGLKKVKTTHHIWAKRPTNDSRTKRRERGKQKTFPCSQCKIMSSHQPVKFSLD